MHTMKRRPVPKKESKNSRILKHDSPYKKNQKIMSAFLNSSRSDRQNINRMTGR